MIRRRLAGGARNRYGCMVGTQGKDGRVTRRVITIHSGGGGDLKADTARQVAAALIAAADELEQLG